MTDYRKSDTGEILTRYQLTAAFPNTSLPADVSQAVAESLGLDRIEETPAPAAGPGQVVEASGIEQVAGAWRKRWAIRDRNAEEIQQLRADLARQATDLRWKRETGGLALAAGIRVGTTSADQARITAVVANARLGGIDEVDFKAESGWVTLPVDQVLGIAGAIARHVQACFSAERRHHEAIAAAADVDLPSYDLTTGWPA